MNKRLKEMHSNFDKVNRVILATVERFQPRTRVITLIKDEEGFFFATGKRSQKITQIKNNPSVEFILTLKKGENNGYIRGECTAEFVEDKKIMYKLFNENEFMKKLWKDPEDPELTIIKLIPSTYHYLRPGEWETTKIIP